MVVLRTTYLRHDVEHQTVGEIRDLALQMMRLDDRARWARDALDFDTMEEVLLERQEVQARRSGLLRAVWAWRRRYWRRVG